MLQAIDRVITWLENSLIVLGMLICSFLLFANVVLRFGFSSGLVWSEEAVRYTIIWIVIGGIGAAAREKAHMSITALHELLKNDKLNRILDGVILLVSLAFGLFLVIVGYQLIASMQANMQRSPAMEIPLWVVYASLPVGGLLFVYRIGQAIWKLRTGRQS